MRHGAQGVGLLRTEFLAHRTDRAADRERSRPTTSAGWRRLSRSMPVIIRTFDLGGDKFPAAFEAPARGQPVPGLALDPRLPRPARGLPAPAARHPPGRRGPGPADHAAAGHPGRGGPERAADPGRGSGRTRAPSGIPAADQGAARRDDRDAGGGRHRRPAGRGLRLLQRRHQRPDPVHPGGRSRATPGSPTASRPHHPAIVRQLLQVRAAAAGGRIQCQRLRRDGLGAAHRRPAVGLGYARLSVAPPRCRSSSGVVRSMPDAAADEAAERALEAGNAGRGARRPSRRRAPASRPAASSSARWRVAGHEGARLRFPEGSIVSALTGHLMTVKRARSQATPLHLRVGHRGPPGQGGRPDFRRRPRCDPGARPAWPRGVRDAGDDGHGRGRRRDHHHDLRAHPGHRAHDGRPRSATTTPPSASTPGPAPCSTSIDRQSPDIAMGVDDRRARCRAPATRA